MARTVLVTGASGFVGTHLARRLVADGYAVTACGRGGRPATLSPNVRWHQGDLATSAGVASLPRTFWGVIHLAAESVPARIDSPAAVLANVLMLLNLVEHLDDARLVIASSCHVYEPGAATKTESSPTRPAGRYGLSKLLAEQAALASRLDVRVARPFNHLGIGMPPSLAIPSLIRRIREGADHEPLELFGLDSTRDFLDVADIISAYIAILTADAPPTRVFNVCSGLPVTIGEVAAIALRLAGQTRPVVFHHRPSSGDDTDRLVGDSALVRQATGWTPQITLEASLTAMLGEADPVR